MAGAGYPEGFHVGPPPKPDPPAQRPTIDLEDREAAALLVLDWSATLPDDTRLSTWRQLELIGRVTAALADARAREREHLQTRTATPGEDAPR